MGFSTGLGGADLAPLLALVCCFKGWCDLIKLGVARADSRAAYPCPLCRRFGLAASSPGELHLEHPSQRSPPRSLLRQTDVPYPAHPCPLLHKLVTPSDYSLPGGSSPIASALAHRCLA
jgi:hypothetical protein